MKHQPITYLPGWGFLLILTTLVVVLAGCGLSDLRTDQLKSNR